MHARKRLERWVTDREAEGQRRWQVAGTLGLSPSMLTKLLQGDRRPGLASAIAIEKVAGISMKDWGDR